MKSEHTGQKCEKKHRYHMNYPEKFIAYKILKVRNADIIEELEYSKELEFVREELILSKALTFNFQLMLHTVGRCVENVRETLSSQIMTTGPDIDEINTNLTCV